MRRPPSSALGRIGALILKWFGWSTALALPVPPRCVIVIYPHTSNWDFVVGLLAKWVLDLDVRWLGKDSMFRTPLAPLFRRWGGIPVNRNERTGIIDRLATCFSSESELRLVIAPEGTRRRTLQWKSGFYHLALAAKVPLGLAYFDYRKREVGIGAWITLSGDAAQDMARIAAFYRDKAARRPLLAGPVRLAAPQPRRSPPAL